MKHGIIMVNIHKFNVEFKHFSSGKISVVSEMGGEAGHSGIPGMHAVAQ